MAAFANKPEMADGVGFEPTVSLHPRRFSRPAWASYPIVFNKKFILAVISV